MNDLRFGVRMLLKSPAVTALAVASLALGIGANAAIFSLYSQFLVRPLPVHEPGRLVNLGAPGPKPGSESCNGQGGCEEVFSYPMFEDLRREQTVFSDLAAHRGFGASVAYQGQGRGVVQGMQVSGSYFETLGLLPAMGRLLGPEVDEPVGGHPVAVVSHAFWQDDLGGTADVVGEVLSVNGEALTIVGVAPSGFRGTTMNMPAAIFVPLTMHERLDADAGEGRLQDRRNYWLYLFARLRPQVRIEQARAGMAPLYRSILVDVEASLHPHLNGQALARFVARELVIEEGRRGQSAMQEGVGVPLFLLLGVTGIVLLIACVNIANLLLARSSARATEMAIRLSLGASRGHLIKQLLVESCLLAAVGGTAGLFAAQWTLRFIGTLLPTEVVEILVLTLDPYAVPFTGGVALATGLLFGVYPAFHGTRVALVAALKDDAGHRAVGRSDGRVRRGLVTAQLALAMTLLVLAGLFIQSLRNVGAIEPGFQTRGVVTFRLWPGLSGYEVEQERALYDQVEEQLATQPGVEATTVATIGVLTEGAWDIDVTVDGLEAGPDTDRSTQLNQVGTDYFHTLEIPLLAGRTFTEADGRRTPRVAIVNEAFARKFQLGRNPVGRRLGRGGLNAALDTEIVGLVADSRHGDVTSPTPPLLYVPYLQGESVGSLVFYVRNTLPPGAVLRTVPALMNGLDPNVAVTTLTSLAQQVEGVAFEERAVTVLSGALAGLAALLATVGVYGVLAYTVNRRTPEFGLRMALGAQAAQIRVLVLHEVGRMALVGGTVGLVAALGIGRMVRSLLYGVEGLPAAVIGVGALSLAVVALAAGFVPARRAGQIDPLVAMRDR